MAKGDIISESLVSGVPIIERRFTSHLPTIPAQPLQNSSKAEPVKLTEAERQRVIAFLEEQIAQNSAPKEPTPEQMAQERAKWGF